MFGQRHPFYPGTFTNLYQSKLWQQHQKLKSKWRAQNNKSNWHQYIVLNPAKVFLTPGDSDLSSTHCHLGVSLLQYFCCYFVLVLHRYSCFRPPAGRALFLWQYLLLVTTSKPPLTSSSIWGGWPSFMKWIVNFLWKMVPCWHLAQMWNEEKCTMREIFQMLNRAAVLTKNYHKSV